MIRDPATVRFSATPRGMQVHADFMHDVGTLKNKAASWKDLFWDNMWTKDGS
jgi:NitT/TauT family transport system substrate-binding protein